MNAQSVIAQCDVHMTWTGPHPRYRVWINGELFTERTWIWSEDFYLQEILPISAQPGVYSVHYEVLDPAYASIKIRNWQLIAGPAQIASTGIDTGTVTIMETT